MSRIKKCQTTPSSGVFHPLHRTPEQIYCAEQHLIEQRESIRFRARFAVPEPPVLNQLCARQCTQEQIQAAEQHLIEQRGAIRVRARYEVTEPREYEWPLPNQLIVAELEESQVRTVGSRFDPNEERDKPASDEDRDFGQWQRELCDLIPESVLQTGNVARTRRLVARDMINETDASADLLSQGQSEETAAPTPEQPHQRGEDGRIFAPVRSRSALREEVFAEDVGDDEGLGRIRGVVMMPRRFRVRKSLPVRVMRWKWSQF